MTHSTGISLGLVAYVTRPDLISQKPQFFSAVMNSLILAKCIVAHLWENSPFVSRQLKGIGPTFSTLLATAGKVSFMLLEESHPRDLERIMNKGAPAGNVLRKQVSLLPKYQLSMIPVDENSVTLQVILLNQNYLSENIEQLTTGSIHKSYVVVGDSNNNLLLLASFKIKDMLSVYDGIMTHEIRRKQNYEHKIFAHCISSSFVGIDVQSEYIFNDLSKFFGEPNIDCNKINTQSKEKKQTCITDTFKERKRKSNDHSDKMQSKEKKKRENAVIENFKYLKNTFETASKNIKDNVNMSCNARKFPYYNVGSVPEQKNTISAQINTDCNEILNNENVVVEDSDNDDDLLIDNEKVNSILTEIENEMFKKQANTPLFKKSETPIVTKLLTQHKLDKLKVGNGNKRKNLTTKSNYDFMDLLEKKIDLNSDDEKAVAVPGKGNGFSDTIKNEINKYIQNTCVKQKAPDVNVQLLLDKCENKNATLNANVELDETVVQMDTDGHLTLTQKILPSNKVEEMPMIISSDHKKLDTFSSMDEKTTNSDIIKCNEEPTTHQLPKSNIQTLSFNECNSKTLDADRELDHAVVDMDIEENLPPTQILYPRYEIKEIIGSITSVNTDKRNIYTNTKTIKNDENDLASLVSNLQFKHTNFKIPQIDEHLRTGVIANINTTNNEIAEINNTSISKDDYQKFSNHHKNTQHENKVENNLKNAQLSADALDDNAINDNEELNKIISKGNTEDQIFSTGKLETTNETNEILQKTSELSINKNNTVKSFIKDQKHGKQEAPEHCLQLLVHENNSTFLLSPNESILLLDPKKNIGTWKMEETNSIIPLTCMDKNTAKSNGSYSKFLEENVDINTLVNLEKENRQLSFTKDIRNKNFIQNIYSNNPVSILAKKLKQSPDCQLSLLDSATLIDLKRVTSPTKVKLLQNVFLNRASSHGQELALENKEDLYLVDTAKVIHEPRPNVHNNETEANNSSYNRTKYSTSYAYTATQIDICSNKTKDYCTQVIKKIKLDCNITQIVSTNQLRVNTPRPSDINNADKIVEVENNQNMKLNINNDETLNCSRNKYAQNTPKEQSMVKDIVISQVPPMQMSYSLDSKPNTEIDLYSSPIKPGDEHKTIEDIAENSNEVESKDAIQDIKSGYNKVQNILQKYSQIFPKNTNETCPSSTLIKNSVKSNLSPPKLKKPFRISDIHKLHTTLPESIINNKQTTQNFKSQPAEKESIGSRSKLQENPISYFHGNKDSAVLSNSIMDTDIDPIIMPINIDLETNTDLKIDNLMFDPRTLLQSTTDSDSEEIIPPPPQFCDLSPDLNDDHCKSGDSLEFLDNINVNDDAVDNFEVNRNELTELTPSREIETWTLEEEDHWDSKYLINSSAKSFTTLRRNIPDFCDVSSRQAKLGQFKFSNKSKLSKYK